MTAPTAPSRLARSLVMAFVMALALAAVLPHGPAQGAEGAQGTEGAAGSAGPSVDLAETYPFSDDPEQIAKTWDKAYVFVPGAAIGSFIYGRLGSPAVQARLAALPESIHHPIVVFLHDAGGVTGKVNRLLKALEIENFAMVLPDSYARDGRRFDCEGKSWNPENCAMSPDIYLARRSELIHAVEAARRLPWVDQQNVFLVGSGEGAIAVALWGGEVDVSGYVVADWTCTAPADQPWFDGLRIPGDRPTLALATRGHRWAGRPGWDGTCADKAADGANVTAVMIDSSIRSVFELPEARRALIEFLYANLRPRLN